MRESALLDSRRIRGAMTPGGAIMDQVVVSQFIDRLASAFEEDDADAAVKAAESANVRRVQEN